MSAIELATVVPYYFTPEDHFEAEREGLIKQMNSFKQSDQHTWGNYDFRDGIYGEIAFARWLGVERQPHEIGKLHDGGFDFVDISEDDGSLTTIDVKTTAAQGAWSSAHLMREKRYSLKADVYVLVVMPPDRSRARFAGWVSKAHLANARVKRKEDKGRPKVYVPTRVMHESDLNHDWRGWA